ncbi:DUF1616 domain-containing protein [Halopelagius longus]|uniref:DUF1616 domain-containing protein n=1 Tax=Halopelagius longus TaxID=1236180 RepID=A0A1H1GMQ7_9EURY|nr:DUF1616 domain-containing protein [Halopelagius longus]RDI69649.1 DUF1616 domain-containing protein [Halopelagius longus]SDR14502.1 Uncharacterized membrane protein [Halopelagius longus]
MSRKGLAADAIVTLALVAGTAFVVSSGIGGPLQVVAGAVLVLFLPGYAVSTLVFPATESGRSPSDVMSRRGNAGWQLGGGSGPKRAGLPFLERLAFGFGLSVAFVPVFAWTLDVGMLEYQRPAIIGIATGTAAVATILGAVRRARTPDGTRYVVPFAHGVAGVRDAFDGSNGNRAVNAALAVAILLAVGAVTFSLAAPADGSEFTQVSILTEQENGNLTAGGYPEQFTSGTSSEMVLLVENYEHERTKYTAVVQLQRVEDGQVVEREELNRESQTLYPGQSWQYGHRVTPTMEGQDLRLVYLVYRGDAPADAREETAYRSVNIWFDVVPVGNGNGANGSSQAATDGTTQTATETATQTEP